jgi:hypothetical protein
MANSRQCLLSHLGESGNVEAWKLANRIIWGECKTRMRDNPNNLNHLIWVSCRGLGMIMHEFVSLVQDRAFAPPAVE